MLLLKYDIRGLLNKDIYPELIDYLLKSFLRVVKTKKILIASDFNKRNLIIKNYFLTHYPNLFEDLKSLPSPIFYFYVINKKTPGIMLTASHLPFNYVGLKFVLTDGTNWKPSKLKNFSSKSKFKKTDLKLSFNKELFEIYFQDLKKLFPKGKKFFVSFNTKNSFLKISLPYFRLLNVFQKPEADFFIDSDGDNDRIFIYYRKRKIIPDVIFYFLSLDRNYKKLGVPIYFSKFLEKKLISLGKKFFYIETGHINFKKAYKRYDLDLAFEPSGHFYFFKDLKTEAPYLALVKFLNIWNKDTEDFLINVKIRRFSLKLNKELNLKNLVIYLKNKFSLKSKEFDGFYLFDNKKNIFIHLRKSATENVLRISLEGDNLSNLLKEIKNVTTRNS